MDQKDSSGIKALTYLHSTDPGSNTVSMHRSLSMTRARKNPLNFVVFLLLYLSLKKMASFLGKEVLYGIRR